MNGCKTDLTLLLTICYMDLYEWHKTSGFRGFTEEPPRLYMYLYIVPHLLQEIWKERFSWKINVSLFTPSISKEGGARRFWWIKSLMTYKFVQSEFFMVPVLMSIFSWISFLLFKHSVNSLKFIKQCIRIDYNYSNFKRYVLST